MRAQITLPIFSGNRKRLSRCSFFLFRLTFIKVWFLMITWSNLSAPKFTLWLSLLMVEFHLGLRSEAPSNSSTNDDVHIQTSATQSKSWIIRQRNSSANTIFIMVRWQGAWIQHFWNLSQKINLFLN